MLAGHYVPEGAATMDDDYLLVGRRNLFGEG
jgi:hypothetical protein